MFGVIQFPVADFRPLLRNQRGRLLVPDWSNPNLDTGFIRGFGKISRRNGLGLGTMGEHSFADVNNAVRIRPIIYKQKGACSSFIIRPWFRRFYFDGQISGRFDFGFLFEADHWDDCLNSDGSIDSSEIASAMLEIKTEVHCLDGSKTPCEIGSCSEALGHAYIVSTTGNSNLIEYPVLETYEKFVFLGDPVIHIRIPNNIPVKKTRDRIKIIDDGDNLFFITSSSKGEKRHNVIVEGSSSATMDETGKERVRRVLFAHLNSILFSYVKLCQNQDIVISKDNRSILQNAINAMIQRLAITSKDSILNEDFNQSIQLFISSRGNGVEVVVEKLQKIAEKINKPTLGAKSVNAAKEIFNGIMTTAVKAAVETMLKNPK